MGKEWDEETDRLELLSFVDSIDSDDIKIKEQIKKVLLKNKYIIHVLNNKKLEKADAEFDEYFPLNIKPYYYVINDTQTDNENYLCFDVGYKNLDKDKSFKLLQITFYILCYQGDIIDEDTGVARHDLLAALVQDQFNYTNIFGSKVKLISDTPSATDTNYATRTLVFEQIADNNLVKSGYTNSNISVRSPRLANKYTYKNVEEE